MFDQIPNISGFEYAYQHLNLVAYPAVGVFIWRASKWFNDVVGAFKKTGEQIDILATNHFPHIQASLANQDGLMHTMNESLKTLVERQSPTRKRKRK